VPDLEEFQNGKPEVSHSLETLLRPMILIFTPALSSMGPAQKTLAAPFFNLNFSRQTKRAGLREQILRGRGLFALE